MNNTSQYGDRKQRYKELLDETNQLSKYLNFPNNITLKEYLFCIRTYRRVNWSSIGQ